MSVPAGERRESRLEVFVQALDLVTYTLRITKNEKIFLPEYQKQVTDDIIETAKDIYIDAWDANNVRVVTKDDSLLFHQSKEYLEHCRKVIEKILADKGLEFNPKKTKVFDIRDGFMFLGFKYRLSDTGKVIMTIDPKNVKEERRKLRRLVRKAKKGNITKAKVDECFRGWKDHAAKGNSFKLIQRMEAYYKKLWEE